MAEEEKSVSQLKKERTAAKSKFSKKSTFIINAVSSMVESELKDQWKALSSEAEKLLDANSSYSEGLLEEAREHSTEVSRQHAEDVEEASRDCMAKLLNVSQLIKSQLWSRYGEKRVLFAIGEAEEAKAETEGAPLAQLTYQCHERQFNHLEELSKAAEKELSAWIDWAPNKAIEDVDRRLRALLSSINKLKRDREAELGRSQKATEEMDRVRCAAAEEEHQKAFDRERVRRAEAEEEERTKRAQLLLAQQAEVEARAELVRAQQKAFE